MTRIFFKKNQTYHLELYSAVYLMANYASSPKKKKNPRAADLGVAVVDDDLSGPFLEDDTGDGALPPAGTEEFLRRESPGKPRFHVLLDAHCLQIGRKSGGSRGDDGGRRGFEDEGAVGGSSGGER